MHYLICYLKENVYYIILTTWIFKTRTYFKSLHKKVPNYDVTDTMFNDAYEKFNADVEAIEKSLREVRALVITVTRNLENDLAALPPNVESLKTVVANVDAMYVDLSDSLFTSVVDIEAAMTEGVGDQVRGHSNFLASILNLTLNSNIGKRGRHQALGAVEARQGHSDQRAVPHRQY